MLLVQCPFCKDNGFDLIGLKAHYEKGYCDVYNETINEWDERRLKIDATKGVEG